MSASDYTTSSLKSASGSGMKSASAAALSSSASRRLPEGSVASVASFDNEPLPDFLVTMLKVGLEDAEKSGRSNQGGSLSHSLSTAGTSGSVSAGELKDLEAEALEEGVSPYLVGQVQGMAELLTGQATPGNLRSLAAFYVYLRLVEMILDQAGSRARFNFATALERYLCNHEACDNQTLQLTHILWDMSPEELKADLPAIRQRLESRFRITGDAACLDCMVLTRMLELPFLLTRDEAEVLRNEMARMDRADPAANKKKLQAMAMEMMAGTLDERIATPAGMTPQALVNYINALPLNLRFKLGERVSPSFSNHEWAQVGPANFDEVYAPFL